MADWQYKQSGGDAVREGRRLARVQEIAVMTWVIPGGLLPAEEKKRSIAQGNRGK